MKAAIFFIFLIVLTSCSILIRNKEYYFEDNTTLCKSKCEILYYNYSCFKWESEWYRNATLEFCNCSLLGCSI